jgi:hypothetical protein
VKTLFESTVPTAAVRECSSLLKKSDKKRYILMTEATEGFLDSDEEDSLHQEIDNMTIVQNNDETLSEDWWERHGARLFNQLALHIVNIEHSYMLLHQVMCCSLPTGERPDADPMLNMENVGRALVVLETNSRLVDLDKCVEETHTCMKPFKLLLTPKARRANTDQQAGTVRFSTFVAASSIFRGAILNMNVDSKLCVFCRSILGDFFDEQHGR